MKKYMYLTSMFIFGILIQLPAQKSSVKSDDSNAPRTFVDQSYFGKVKATNIKGLNTEELEMCPIPFEDGLVFTSVRRSSNIDVKGTVSKKKFTDLYFSQAKADGSFITPQLLKGSVNGPLHDGMVTFTKDFKTMYFTRNNKNGNAEDGIVDLKICSAELVNGEWTNVKDLSFNSKKFSNCHPALSPDNNSLYFASNRPGGFGGMDIYKVEMLNGKWGDPVNMGKGLNSSGNDIFPFCSEEGNVFFSSDGHGGEGALDIFLSLGVEGEDWGEVQNLGKPFNSPSDDFGFYTNRLGTFGYFSSSRAGGMGRDDIFRWDMETEATVEAVQQLVSADLENWEETFQFQNVSYEDPITEADVEEMNLLSSKIEVIDEEINDLKSERQSVRDGDTKLMLDSKIMDALIEKHELAMNLHTKTLGALFRKQEAASKTDHRLLDQSNALDNLIKKHEMAMASHAQTLKELMEEQKAVMAEDTRLLKESNHLDVKIKKHEVLMADHTYKLATLLLEHENPEAGEAPDWGIAEVEEDFGFENQFDQWEVQRENDPSQELVNEPMMLSEVMTAMGGTPVATTTASTVNIASGSRPSVVSGSIRFERIPESYENAPVNNVPVTPIYENLEVSYESTPELVEIEPAMLSDIIAMAEAPKVGTVFSIGKVYYDFNDAQLKSESTIELEKVVSLLQDNPGMKITIMSHTDSRGNSDYNFDLSQRRAESVLNYLVNRNVSRDRLRARGYGENMLVNQCPEGIDCSDEEHAMNRRTEFKIDQVEEVGTNSGWTTPDIFSSPQK